MAGIFSRIFKIGQSEAHSVVDKFEDPIKMTEQGIRDLKNDLRGSLESLAEVKATAARLKRDLENRKSGAADYERKAMLLIQKAQTGQVPVQEAERLARESLVKKEQMSQQAVQLTRDYEKQEQMAANLQAQVEKLRSAVTRYENDLITLKARAKTATAMKKINKQLAKVDATGTLTMLEKMRAKVEEDESLANAYGEIVSVETSVDDEITKALAGATVQATDPLLELKAKMGLLPPAVEEPPPEATELTP